ncbi:ABC transporter permease [Streptomyces sp. NPDC014983]|uniref:ABC transporter permease n=1 Tax=Streptomyces sp. NPDC014983 TaxID=3364933 RepID=UPI0036FFC0F9
MRRSLVLLAALGILGLLLLAAAAPGLFASHSPTDVDLGAVLQPPSGRHWFGTDQLGRDVWSRVVHGTRISLLTGLAATALAGTGGTALALLMVLGGRVVDSVLIRVLDVLLAFPGLLLTLLVVAVTGPGAAGALTAIAIASVPGYARMVRAQAQVVRRSDYVTAAVVMGVRRPVVIWRHVLPNALRPLIVLATLGIGEAVIIGSSLGFLGLGPPQPAPEWGAMLAAGRDHYTTAWWIAAFPGLVITALVMTVTVIGRRVRRRLEGWG